MTILMRAWVTGAILIGGAYAQGAQKPPLTRGASVQMAVADHASEMRAADEPNATVVAITAEGKVYAGVKATEPAALSALTAETVFVKADARAPYQKVLAVLDALRGKSVVLLTASPRNAAQQGYLPPYGVRLSVAR